MSHGYNIPYWVIKQIFVPLLVPSIPPTPRPLLPPYATIDKKVPTAMT